MRIYNKIRKGFFAVIMFAGIWVLSESTLYADLKLPTSIKPDSFKSTERLCGYAQGMEKLEEKENFASLLGLRAVPYFRDGEKIGIRLFAIKKDSPWEKVGLRNGDVLKSIDKQSVEDLKCFYSLIVAALKERKKQHIFKVIRNGQELTLSLG